MRSNFIILCKTNQAALTSKPVNGSKSVEVLQHEAVKVSEAIQLPEIVQVSPPVLPQSRDLIERPDNAAAFQVPVSDHRHAAAEARAWRQLLGPGQLQHHGVPPNTPLGHLRRTNAHSALPSTATLTLPRTLVQKEEAGGWSRVCTNQGSQSSAALLNL